MSPSVRTALVAVAAVLLGFAGGWLARGAWSPGEAPALAAAHAPAPRATVPPDRPLPNVLVLVADDVGQDMIGAYGLSDAAPKTPHVDALAAEGLIFRNATAEPLCSPTRATLLTGRNPWRYGIGNAIPPKAGWDLPTTERILPVSLREGTGGRYTSVALGKWHLATPDRGGYDHPRRMGFDHHVGTMGNLLGNVAGGPQTYFHWQRVVDGVPTVVDGYVTSATVDDTLEQVRSLPEPWFLYVAFHAAHFPMHVPPDGLATTPLPASPTEAQLYRAMVEALDTEIGRLLDGIPADVRARTDVVFLGDNGSAPSAVLPPFQKSHAKGSLTRGGIQVPFVVAGPDVHARGETDALIQTTDLYATVLDLAGIDEAPPVDSISFAPVLADAGAASRREIAYAERFGPNGPADTWTYHEAVARDLRYKLLIRNGEESGLFDLVEDPFERRNLFRFDGTPELRAEVRKLRAAIPEVATVTRSGLRTDDEEP